MTLEEAQRRYATPASRFATIAGVPLHWIDEGPADAPLAIVLLPGQWLGARQADEWASHLPTHRVIRLDLPGQGLAGPFPDGDYSMPRYAALLAAWLEATICTRYILVGTSFGGLIAILHAATKPPNLAALVLANASGLPRPGGASVAPAATDGTPRDAAFFREKLTPLLTAIDDAVITETADLDRLPGRPDEATYRNRAFTSAATLDALARIEVPVLLQWSTESTYLPPEMATRFAAALPHTTTRLYPGIRHLILLDAPEATARDLAVFLEDIA